MTEETGCEHPEPLRALVTQVSILPTPDESKKDGCMHLGILFKDEETKENDAAVLHIPFREALAMCATIQAYMTYLEALGDYEPYLERVQQHINTVMNDVRALSEIERQENL